MKIKIILTPDRVSGGYTVTVPLMESIVTQGDTIEEAIEMAKDAILSAIEGQDFFIDNTIKEDDIVREVEMNDIEKILNGEVMSLKEALIYIRDGKHKKVTDIAKTLGISREYYYRIINDERNVRELTQESIAKKIRDKFDLNVDVNVAK